MSARRSGRRILVRSREVWERMDRLNISQNELAHLLERSSPYVSQILNQVKSPSPDTRRRMLKVLGGEFDDLFVVVEAEDE